MRADQARARCTRLPGLAGRPPSHGVIMRLETYRFFNGNCEAALAFYRETTGAETLL